MALEAGPKKARDARWRDLGVRTASGVVLAAIGLATMWLGGPVWAACICMLGALMGAEWVALCAGRGAAWLAAGLVYIGPAVVALVWLRGVPDGWRLVLFLAAIVWGGDVGAYLIGRLVGGPRLAPRISPGKTWSGAAGGTLVAVLAGLAVRPEHAQAAGAAALVLSTVAQAGDLLESAFKRRFGVKDSGTLIPGHGGLLDRLDGVLTSAPVLMFVVWEGRKEGLLF